MISIYKAFFCREKHKEDAKKKSPRKSPLKRGRPCGLANTRGRARGRGRGGGRGGNRGGGNGHGIDDDRTTHEISESSESEDEAMAWLGMKTRAQKRAAP